ncbi:P-loop containing nucleoside triphosphate hydrolase protein [Aspergillus pseudodeflectus]|uniref:P-loop containing nucleoside triphosphate hydrolase protein n=1 Tax=Aspergillus pseudodeflectus TaxID=176178 RepID=A0ABR4K720_9EURO
MGSLLSLPTSTADATTKHRAQKVLFIGPVKVGKTSLLTRFTHDSFDEHIPPTEGVDLVRVTFPHTERSSLIWDCCGKERYWYAVPAFSRDARVVVAVYDMTSRASFDDVLRNIESHAGQAHVDPTLTRYVLVGNKVDLEEKRDVERAVGEEVAARMGYKFLETSARSGMGIGELLEAVGMIVAGRDEDDEKVIGH